LLLAAYWEPSEGAAAFSLFAVLFTAFLLPLYSEPFSCAAFGFLLHVLQPCCFSLTKFHAAPQVLQPCFTLNKNHAAELLLVSLLQVLHALLL
jgi:hypothetical protein